MNKISIAQLGEPSLQWRRWTKALVNAGLTVCMVNPIAMELQTVFARAGDVILLDGSLPNLDRFIKRTCARCPEAHIIVVTEEKRSATGTFTNRSNAAYLSGPMQTDRFVKRIIMDGHLNAAIPA